MTLGHVADFVCQYGSQFRLALRSDDQPGVDTDEPSRQGKSVDRLVIQNEKFELLLDVWSVRNQRVAKRIDIVRHLGVVQELRTRADLAHDVLAQLPLLLRGYG